MKIAVLSDIHGNSRALKMCLSYMKWRNVDAYCFLGDYIGELPGVKETLDIIRELDREKTCYIIKGNKEDYQLMGLGDEHPEWAEYKSITGMLRYGAQVLALEDIEYIKTLPHYMALKFDGLPDLLICHGSPLGTKRPVFTKNGPDQEVIDCIEQDYVICGHTHVQGHLEYEGKKLWNAGSAGLTIQNSSKAECMIIHGHDGIWEPEFLNLDYDYEAEIKDMRDSSLYEIAPYWSRITESLLRGGNVSHGTVLNRAMEICRKDTGKCEWPCIPEKYMAKAYEEMIG